MAEAQDDLARSTPLDVPADGGVYAVSADHAGGEVRVGSAFTVYSDAVDAPEPMTFLVTTYDLVAVGDEAAVASATVHLPTGDVVAPVTRRRAELRPGDAEAGGRRRPAGPAVAAAGGAARARRPGVARRGRGAGHAGRAAGQHGRGVAARRGGVGAVDRVPRGRAGGRRLGPGRGGLVAALRAVRAFRAARRLRRAGPCTLPHARGVHRRRTRAPATPSAPRDRSSPAPSPAPAPRLAPRPTPPPPQPQPACAAAAAPPAPGPRHPRPGRRSPRPPPTPPAPVTTAPVPERGAGGAGPLTGDDVVLLEVGWDRGAR